MTTGKVIMSAEVKTELGVVSVFYTPDNQILGVDMKGKGDYLSLGLKQDKKMDIRKGSADDLPVGELAEYFAKKRKQFSVPVIFTGTPFQKRVWEECRRIPYGQTSTYGELAKKVFTTKKSSPRAVGQALGANPLAIVVPCHRVLAKDGGLGGYGGGLKWKSYLLDLEGAKYKK